ncbi:hypothetical protein Tco_1195880 [Tanacetum coccineum]
MAEEIMVMIPERLQKQVNDMVWYTDEIREQAEKIADDLRDIVSYFVEKEVKKYTDDERYIMDSSPPSRVSATLQSLGLGGGGCLRKYVRIVAGMDDKDSDSDLLIQTPWSDESNNEKRAKRWREEFEWKISLFEIDLIFGINAFDLEKGTEVMKNKVSQEHVCAEEVPLNNNIGKQSGNLVEMPSKAVEQGIDDHVPDEIDGAIGEQVLNHVVKKGS